MAFNGFSRKTWTDRVSEYPTRRILTDTTSQATQQVTVSRDEGTVTSQGDTFDAETMNNLEARIASSFTEDEAAIGNLTNLTTTEKTNLVGALNEVKASVPPLVDELNDLDDVSISPATAGSGDTLIFNSGTLKWEDGQLQAAQVGFTPDTVSTSMPSGFTDVQKAVDYVCELADDVKASKADIQDPEFIGNPTAPTQAKGNNSTRLATTAFVQAAKNTGLDSKDQTSTSVSVPSSTSAWTQVSSVSLTAGIWMIIATVNFAKQTTTVGYRAAMLTNQSSSSSANMWGTEIIPAAENEVTRMQVTAIVQPTQTTTYYLFARQNSNASINVTSRMAYIKLSS